MENNNVQKDLTNTGAILGLAIASIVTCICCTGVVGIILGLISFFMSNKAIQEYESNPEMYTENSFSRVKTGKTIAIIGIVCSIIGIISLITQLSTLGLDGMMNQQNELLEMLQQ